MANIIGTVITVEKFLQNEEAKVYLPSTPDDGPAIVLEKDRKYIIPDFQREIRWKDENIVQLASDILNGAVFLGNIILSRKRGKKYDIIDGQQRITILLMLLKYIEHIFPGGVTLFPTCSFQIDSFQKYSELIACNYDPSSMGAQERKAMDESDLFNQTNRYCQLWNAIGDSEVITVATYREFHTNLKRCELNILLDTAEGGGYSVQYFLDVNLKGIRLDTEDILKSYLFSNDSSEEIRNEWNELKKNVFRLEPKMTKYSLIKIVEQFLRCELFKLEHIKNSSLDFNERFELKAKKVVNGKTHQRKEHIVKVINNNAYMRSSIEKINKYLDIVISIIETDGVGQDFKDLFNANGSRLVEPSEIKVIHNLLKKVLLDENNVPKLLVMKYILDVFLSGKPLTKANIKKVYGVYCLAVLFTIFDDKRNSTQVKNIAKEDDWNSSIVSQIKKYLRGELTQKRLAAKYKVMLLESVENDEGEQEWEESNDTVALSTYRYRCKSLATIYNYFRIEDDIVKVSNFAEIYAYLNDDERFSVEHFILNECGKYFISDTAEEVPYPEEIDQYKESLFNFIFMPRAENDSLGNMHIADKLDAIEENPINLTCEYSQMVLDQCTEVFRNKPDTTSIEEPDEIREAYRTYYKASFLDDYSEMVKKVIAKVVERIGG